MTRTRCERASPSIVVTRMKIAVAPIEAWRRLLFFEDVVDPPPLPLRILLPSPIRTEGCKTKLGDEARCLYTSGYLRKRVTRIDEGRLYGFEIIEQALDVGRGIRLLGGGYELRGLPGGATVVALETRYESPRRPGWIWGPIETAVCHLFHRHLLAAIRRQTSVERTATDTAGTSR